MNAGRGASGFGEPRRQLPMPGGGLPGLLRPDGDPRHPGRPLDPRGETQMPGAGMVEDGRHCVYDTTPLHRGRAEVPSSAYADVLRQERRSLLPAFGAVLAGVAYVVFTAGEVRQADARSKRTHAD
ncbi:hypothetical protein GCM10018771_23560 [Streptomyces cellulosae]|nr:hypothetical protein GCM10018771_23560 [Streptomyces cellulosae]